MRKLGWLGVALLVLACLAWIYSGQMTAVAEEQADVKTEAKAEAKTEVKKAEHGFIGASQCKMCHKSEAKGAQFVKWEASPHAHAYKTLLTDQSKEIAKKMGIKEAPEAADQCLKCHVTGHGAKAELLGKKYDMTEGVTCEGCHGAAADWKKVHKKDPAEAAKLGMAQPVDEKVCLTCHNEESPTYKPFKYAEKLAAIAHPIPKKAE